MMLVQSLSSAVNGFIWILDVKETIFVFVLLVYLSHESVSIQHSFAIVQSKKERVTLRKLYALANDKAKLVRRQVARG